MGLLDEAAALSGPVRGYIACCITCLCFGACNIPVKRTNVRDGTFFTLCKAGAVLTVGSLQWLIAGRYPFEPFAMLGGALWATGNMFVPFCIQRCGLGVGQLFWSVTTMLVGWACGTFGLLGKESDVDVITNRYLNYLGVVLAVASVCFLARMNSAAEAADPNPGDVGERIASESKCKADSKPGDVGEQIVPGSTCEVSEKEASAGPAGPLEQAVPAEAPAAEHCQADQQASSPRRFSLGLLAAVAIGFFIGFNFNPVTYLMQLGQQDKSDGLTASQWRHSIRPSDYVVSHHCGIFLTTALYVLAYGLFSGNGKTYWGSDVIRPGVQSGIMWGIGHTAWFTANEELSFMVAFPIIQSVPGVMAALWGILLFRENSGRHKLALLSLAFAVQIVGVSLVALSRVL
eukprot:TRINITY_DN90266_c0_g1_i1.p1 TRINITY_DN90266_c0_g1~~TRINITY_DN90266_c0_g1_i1.p1  ORF type:complete len:437 (+),score=18.86 TRINITY_DN90266_c0_g1_i1:103-1311(+)